MPAVYNTPRLPSPVIKQILLEADFSADKLVEMREGHPFFADLLSGNSFWVPHSPHGLAARGGRKMLLSARQRRQAAFQALKQQIDSGASPRHPSRKQIEQKIAYLSFDPMLAAARTPHFGDFWDLISLVQDNPNSTHATSSPVRLLGDMTFATAVMRNIEPASLLYALNEARFRLGRRHYRTLCHIALAREPELIGDSLFKTSKGKPARQDRALAEEATSANPRVFAYLSQGIRRQTKLIRRLQAKAGLCANHLNALDTRDPAYIRRLFDAQLFVNDSLFDAMVMRTEVAPAAYLYGRLSADLLLEATGRDAYRWDRTLVGEALRQGAYEMDTKGRNFAFEANRRIGPSRVLNVPFLDALATEQDVDVAMRRRLYDQHARPYGLKTAALERHYARWRAKCALFGAGALLLMYLNPRAGTLLIPGLATCFWLLHPQSLWTVNDLLGPPWQRSEQPFHMASAQPPQRWPAQPSNSMFPWGLAPANDDVEMMPMGGAPADFAWA